jgi:hypothetical protein
MDKAVVGRDALFLLGIWSASWDGWLGEEAIGVRKGDMRVPVGMGSVVPAARLLELLDHPDLVARREAHWKVHQERLAANPDYQGED